MGRVEDYAPEVKQASSRMQHFSHPHPLEEEIFNLQNLPNGFTTLCSGCKLPPSGTMYVCRPCNFTLHSSCAKLPQMITHPSHPSHTLALLPIALYPGGVFSCDACNHQGNGFSFHCHSCDFDLHVNCAIKPIRTKNQLHPCQLELTFVNPYGSNKGFVCDVCSKMGSKQWLYRCRKCSFDVHLDCANATGPRVVTQPQPVMQHFNTFPATAHPQNQFQGTMGIQQHQHGNQLTHNASTGALTPIHQSTTGNQLMPPGQMPVYQPPIGTPIPNQGSYQQLMVPNNQSSLTNSLMAATLQGMVEGAAQAVGQTLVQAVIDGGDGGGTDASQMQN